MSKLLNGLDLSSQKITNVADGTSSTDAVTKGQLDSKTFTSTSITDFNEASQDAVGSILTDTSTISLDYDDVTPNITASVIDGSITNVKISTGIDAIKISGGTVTNAEFDYLANVTSDIQSQLDSKITAFADPNADRIVFWDDSAGAFAALTASTGLSISGTNMTVRTASATQTGIVELATDAETATGTDTTRACTPANIASLSVFRKTVDDTDDITEGATKKFNVTHTGDVTGSDALTIASSAITGKTTITAESGDYFLVSDTSDSGTLKKVDVGDLLGGGYSNEQAQDAIGTILTNSGDITFTYDDATPTITASLTTSGTAGTYGSATEVPVFTVDSKGRITSVTNTTISLTGYVPYTGATSAVVLGANTLSTTSGIISPTVYPSANSTTAFQIRRADGTTSVLNVDTTNSRVGIGTTSPGYLLSVNGQAVFGAIQLLPNTSGVDYIQTETGQTNFTIRNKNASGYIVFGAGSGTERMRLSATGSLSIGTTSANARLHVKGSGLTSSTKTISLTNSSDSEYFSVNDVGTIAITKISESGTRESVLTARVNDDSTSVFGIGNATGANAVFSPVFYGYASNASYTPLVFRSFINSGIDSGTGPVMIFDAMRTSNTADPANGTFSAIVTRPLFSFRNYTTVLLQMQVDGKIGINTATPDNLFHVEASTAVTNSVSYAQRLSHITSSTATTNFGVGIEYELENGSGSNRVAASQDIIWTDATSSSEDASYRLNLIQAGSLTNVLNISSLGEVTSTRVLVEANTAVLASPNAIGFDESQTLFTNEGATALNYHTLPTAVAGLTYTFYVADSDGIRIVANTGDNISVAGTTSTSGGYAESTTIGNSVTLTAINATTWAATSVIGSWTIV